MSVRRNVLIGVGGVVAAATIFGASILPSMSSNGFSEQAAASGRISGEKELIIEYDNARKELLESMVFYVGNATIQETYKAKSSQTGSDPAASGSGTMISEDIIAYDPGTEKSYLVARRLTLLGKVIKDVVDMRGALLGTAMANVGGQLTEYYGTGMLQKRDVAEVIEKNQGKYYLSFKLNPLRMDNKEGMFYTNPPVKKTYWVQIIGSESVDMVATGIFTPETLENTDVKLMPGISVLEAEKTYNSNETYVYEGTDGLWIPQGSLYYKYNKTTYAEIEDFLKELKAEAYGDAVLEEAVQPLSDPWKDTVEIADGLQDIDLAAGDMRSMTEGFVPESASDGSAYRDAAESLVNGNEFSTEYLRLQNALRELESEDGVVRKLEGFSMDSDGTTEEREAAEAAQKVVPLLKQYLAKYKPSMEKLYANVGMLASYLSADGTENEKIKQVVEEVAAQTNEINELAGLITVLYSNLDSTLLNLQASKEGNKNEYSALAELFARWEESLKGYLTGSAPVVDLIKGVSLPPDYPVDIMPLTKDAVVVIAEKMTEDGEEGFNLTLKTNMTATDVLSYYRNALSGVEINVFEIAGVTTLSGEKDDYEFSIMAMANNLGGEEKTLVQIVLLKM